MFYRRIPGTACRPIDGVMILVHSKDPVMLTLNRTGGYIWSRLDGLRDESGLAGQMREAGVGASPADVGRFLEDLAARGFCERADAASDEPDRALPLEVESPQRDQAPAIASVESIEAMMGLCSDTIWRGSGGCMTMPGFCSVLQS